MDEIRIPRLKCNKHPDQKLFDKFTSTKVQVYFSGYHVPKKDAEPITKKVSVLCPICHEVVWSSDVIRFSTRVGAGTEE